MGGYIIIIGHRSSSSSREREPPDPSAQSTIVTNPCAISNSIPFHSITTEMVTQQSERKGRGQNGLPSQKVAVTNFTIGTKRTFFFFFFRSFFLYIYVQIRLLYISVISRILNLILLFRLFTVLFFLDPLLFIAETYTHVKISCVSKKPSHVRHLNIDTRVCE